MCEASSLHLNGILSGEWMDGEGVGCLSSFLSFVLTLTLRRLLAKRFFWREYESECVCMWCVCACVLPHTPLPLATAQHLWV